MTAAPALAFALTMTLVVSTGVSAHRRDEYLQAARIGVHLDRVRIDLDLTPGIDTAESITAMIDSDGDGLASPDEQRAYASRVTGALLMKVDGTPLQLRLISSTFPELSAFRRGEGTIRLQVGATHPRWSTGAHRLFFRNGHHADRSAYLANALVPESERITVGDQRRDSYQRELTVDYIVGGPSLASIAGWLLVTLPFAVILVLRFAGRSRKTWPRVFA